MTADIYNVIYYCGNTHTKLDMWSPYTTYEISNNDVMVLDYTLIIVSLSFIFRKTISRTICDDQLKKSICFLDSEHRKDQQSITYSLCKGHS